MKLLNKCSGKLVGEKTRVPKSSLLTELCFADDAVTTASTREDISKATMELEQVTTECGLSISFPKAKLLVAGTGFTGADPAPLIIDSNVIESVPSFRYLGLFVETHGEAALDLDDKIARASRALELLESLCFRTALYQDRHKEELWCWVCCCMQLKLGLLNRRILED